MGMAWQVQYTYRLYTSEGNRLRGSVSGVHVRCTCGLCPDAGTLAVHIPVLTECTTVHQ